MSLSSMLSPGIKINEIDLTHFIPSLGQSGGGFVGQFVWGPVKQRVRVDDPNTLSKIFGKPTDSNFVDWFSCSNFLSYTNNLTAVRVVEEMSSGGSVAALNSSVDGTGILIKNDEHFHSLWEQNNTETFVARYPGIIGDSLKISIADSNTFDSWYYKDEFDLKPGTSRFAATLGASDDELHLVVIDEDGKFTGVPGAILEKYAFLSKALDARGLDNDPIFYGNVLNKNSQYVWYLNKIESNNFAFPGPISNINIVNSGTGYSIPPTVTITGDGTGATATAVIGSTNNIGQIVSINLLNSGQNYVANPTVTITGDGTGATATATINSDTKEVVGIEITSPGSGYTFANVSISAGSGAHGSVIINNSIDVGKVISLTVTNGGSGYTVAPTVTITGDGIGATAVAHLGTEVGVDDDKVVSLTITNAGSGFETSPNVIISGDGTGATATAVIGGLITGITVTNGGSGYTVAPKVIIQSLTGSGAKATATLTGNSVTGITITDPGTGYADANVYFDSGSGATATPFIGSTNNFGKVVAVNILNPGTGYTFANVTFSGGSPTIVASALVSINPISIPESNWATNSTSSTGIPTHFHKLKPSLGVDSYSKSFNGGLDGTKVSANRLIEGWNLFKNVDEIDIGLLFMGDAGGSGNNKLVIQHVIDNIAEFRRDCMVFMSPGLNDVLNKSQTQATENILRFVTDSVTGINRGSSTFGVVDSGWKLQYDVFSDKFRWIPLNADIAGLCARTETDYDAWWSPAGFNRGRIKNVVSLAFNPDKASRDQLYKSNINPVVSFVGEGVLLYGDRTMQLKPSAFSYINVRRLFIALEKSISKSAKYQLFEFNDSFTRSQFVSIVEPYLRQVKARRGVYDFKIICDESNNTPDIIDRGEFVASIFIKPARSINFVTLNFVAVRTGVAFSEVVGSV